MEHLSSAKKKEMLDNRIALQKIFTSILHLARQDLALRGHEEIHSNLYQILRLRSQDVPELKSYLERDGRKWLHNTVVNEILDLMAGTIRQKKPVKNKIIAVLRFNY